MAIEVAMVSVLRKDGSAARRPGSPMMVAFLDLVLIAIEVYRKATWSGVASLKAVPAHR